MTNKFLFMTDLERMIYFMFNFSLTDSTVSMFAVAVRQSTTGWVVLYLKYLRMMSSNER